ncbi:hypothetical protein VPH207E292_0086 [Vibrio phage 207E29-2]
MYIPLHVSMNKSPRIWENPRKKFLYIDLCIYYTTYIIK